MAMTRSRVRTAGRMVATAPSFGDSPADVTLPDGMQDDDVALGGESADDEPVRPRNVSADPDPEMQVHVWDDSAVYGERTHEVAGRTYVFRPGSPLLMPYSEGMPFMRLEGFRVMTLDGRPLRAIERTLGPHEVIHLRTDEVVARLDELSNDALLARCRAYAEGAWMTVERTTRQEMIMFLVDRANAEAISHSAAINDALIQRMKEERSSMPRLASAF